MLYTNNFDLSHNGPMSVYQEVEKSLERCKDNRDEREEKVTFPVSHLNQSIKSRTPPLTIIGMKSTQK